MKVFPVALAMLALAACTHEGQPGTVSRAGMVPRSGTGTPAPVPSSPDSLAIASIEASVDSALRPLSETAPVRLTPIERTQPVLKPLAAPQVCTAREETPAIYEQVMGEVQVVQAEIAPDGTVLRAPIYRRAPVPKVVRPRAEISFEAPCPESLTPEFIASLQRALYARGYYTGPVTRSMDAATSAAIGRYQSERGLDSSQLSLETARSLGLVAVQAN